MYMFVSNLNPSSSIKSLSIELVSLSSYSFFVGPKTIYNPPV